MGRSLVCYGQRDSSSQGCVSNCPGWNCRNFYQSVSNLQLLSLLGLDPSKCSGAVCPKVFLFLWLLSSRSHRTCLALLKILMIPIQFWNAQLLDWCYICSADQVSGCGRCIGFLLTSHKLWQQLHSLRHQWTCEVSSFHWCWESSTQDIGLNSCRQTPSFTLVVPVGSILKLVDPSFFPGLMISGRWTHIILMAKDEISSTGSKRQAAIDRNFLRVSCCLV